MKVIFVQDYWLDLKKLEIHDIGFQGTSIIIKIIPLLLTY